jgi:hypothetical protein
MIKAEKGLIPPEIYLRFFHNQKTLMIKNIINRLKS